MAIEYATWNPEDKSSSITLSNGDLTATDNGLLRWQFLRATQGKSVGKHYFEVLPLFANVGHIVGFSTIDYTTQDETQHYFPGYDQNSPQGWSYGHDLRGANRWYRRSTSGGLGQCLIGTIYRIKADLDAGWIYTAAGEGEFFASPLNAVNLNGQTIYPAFGTYNTHTALTANFGATPFVYDVPEGFNAGWYEGEAAAGNINRKFGRGLNRGIGRGL